MRIEIMIDKEQKISQSTLDALESELYRNLRPLYPKTVIRIRKGSSNGVELTGLQLDEERKQVMQFSEGYQREDSEDYQGILTTKENAEKYKTLEEFKAANLTIAAQSGSIQYELAMK